MDRPTLRRIASGSSVERHAFRTTLMAASASAEEDSGYWVVHDQPSEAAVLSDLSLFTAGRRSERRQRTDHQRPHNEEGEPCSKRRQFNHGRRLPA